nr:MAG TPA: hypothetical protein [Caudoviricetes sp.]
MYIFDILIVMLIVGGKRNRLGSLIRFNLVLILNGS